MIRKLMAFYSPKFVRTIVYMLQSTEYQVAPYLKWFWRTHDFNQVMKRRTLDVTKAARLLLLAGYAGYSLLLGLGIFILAYDLDVPFFARPTAGVGILISLPVILAHMLAVPIALGRWFIVKPKERRLIRESKSIFAKHPGTIIGIAGSYGKTSMKELLLTVLGEGKNVAATPANKNVAISHAYFARKLTGEEDIVIIEYGEGAPGDVRRFAETTRPNIGIITGLAPAHLDKYKTLEAAGQDIFSLAEYLQGKNVYVNAESPATKDFMKPTYQTYSSQSVMGWMVKDVAVGFDGTRFLMVKGNDTLKLHSGLLGRHNVGPLALVAALAFSLGMPKEQVEAGVRKTMPFEHRMQPRPLGGAWIIDDTYNGNLEGVRAGLALLKELPGTRKIYVTPGLVDQGKETASVHEAVGKAIAETAPHKVILMHNSVTQFIQKGLKQSGYTGELVVEEDPLQFYSNIEHVVAAGDVVLMQNDWTDNYN